MGKLDMAVAAAEAGRLSPESYSALLGKILSPPGLDEWKETLRHWFLVLGMLLLVSGVIYFGAYNWEALGRFQKLGLMELLLTGLFAGVILRGLDSREGKVLLVAASAMVGALLAVFGQVYQTGADSYLLFLSWAALITIWCFISRSNLLWTLQLALLNVTFILWWSQRVEGMEQDQFAAAYLLFNLLLALAWWKAERRGDWMRSHPFELLLVAGLTPITLTACANIADLRLTPLALPLLALTLLGLVVWRGRRLATMVTVAASLLCLGTMLSIRLFVELQAIGFLLIGFAIMGQLALVVKWLSGLPRTSPNSPRGEASLEREAEEDDGLPEEGAEAPWYFQALVGFGAWIASLFVLGFFLLWIFGSPTALVLCGGALYAATIRARATQEPAAFLRHSLLSSHLASILVVSSGVAGMIGYLEGTSMMIPTILFATSAYLYRDPLGVYLFGLGFSLCGLTSAGLLADQSGMAGWIVVLAGGATASFLSLERLLGTGFRPSVLPLLRGAVSGLLVAALLVSFDTLNETWRLALSAGIILLCVLAGWKVRLPLVGLGGLALLGAVTSSVPALIVSVLVYGLGFLSKQDFVRALALVTLVAAGSFYYYSLELSLLMKSSVLLLSGLLLLSLRLALRVYPTKEVSTYAF